MYDSQQEIQTWCAGANVAQICKTAQFQKYLEEKNFIMVMVNIKEQFKNMTLCKQIHVKKRRKAYYFVAEGITASERKESRIC